MPSQSSNKPGGCGTTAFVLEDEALVCACCRRLLELDGVSQLKQIQKWHFQNFSLSTILLKYRSIEKQAESIWTSCSRRVLWLNGNPEHRNGS